MADLSISDVAGRIGVRASAIRYYEQIGLLPVAERSGGKRRYDRSVLNKLAVIQHARRIGFTLEEIRQLFHGFRNGAPPSERWLRLSQRKLEELAALKIKIQTMQQLLRKIQNCQCNALDECGEKLLQRRKVSKVAKMAGTS